MEETPAAPCVHVVGLGPAGPELITADTRHLLEAAGTVLLRTARHPAASVLDGARPFDSSYEEGGSFEEVYAAIVAEVVAAATAGPAPVVYAVPGSPAVAERTVALLRAHPAVTGGRVGLVVHPALSFIDLAFVRLGVDPLASGVVLVDGASFAVQAAGQAGPLLVAQCWSRSVLSDIKLSVDTPPAAPVVLLHHLGLPDEELRTVPWDEMDRSLAPDHLTALWIPVLAAPVAGELVRLAELVRVLRQQCPWDREQTHGSLSGHLLEETYEVLEAIDAVAAADSARPGVLAMDDGAARQAVADLEEELGDLLFQVVFHAALAAEEGRFTLADVARGIHDKLVSRHPHVFGDADVSTPEEMATTWEATKKAEKNRTSVTEGIPAALPALALAAKLQRKALAVGMDLSPEADDVDQAVRALRALPAADPGVVNPPEDVDGAARVGEALFAVVGVARRRGIDPEAALRVCSTRFRASVEERG